jgi:hypothetical protein
MVDTVKPTLKKNNKSLPRPHRTAATVEILSRPSCLIEWDIAQLQGQKIALEHVVLAMAVP